MISLALFTPQLFKVPRSERENYKATPTDCFSAILPTGINQSINLVLIAFVSVIIDIF